MDLSRMHLDSDARIFGDHKQATAPKQQIAVGVLAQAHECLRFPVLDRILAPLALPFDDGTRRVMAMGKRQEELARSWLLGLGVHLCEEQRMVTDGEEPFPVLGYTDYALADGALVEMKTVNENVFRTYVLPVADGQRMAESGYWLFPRYYRQLQAYLWLSERETGWVLFWRRDALEFRFVRVARDEACIAEMHEQAATIRRHCAAAMRAYTQTNDLLHPDVLAEFPPHPDLDTNPPCSRCLMRNACEPARRYLLQSQVVDDDYLAGRLRIVEENEDKARAKKRAWEEATERLNGYWDANAPESKRFEIELHGEFIRMVGTRRSDGARVWKRHEMEVAS